MRDNACTGSAKLKVWLSSHLCDSSFTELRLYLVTWATLARLVLLVRW